MPKNTKNNDIRTAAVIALSGNALLAALKIFAGIFSHSRALLGDGLDSLADVLICLLTLFVVKIIAKPADKEHPWGHGRAETVATAFLSFVLFFMGAQLFVNAISNLLANEAAAVPSAMAMLAAVISIAGKSFLAWGQYILGKRADSSLILANAKNMACDVLTSLGVLIGLLISSATGSAYADIIIAGLIGVWIIKTALDIFLKANLELMDGNADTRPYQVIVDAVNAVEGAGNPHRARMRRIAGFWDIDFDIDIDPQCTVLEAHNIACQIEDEIKKRLENVYDIMIHMEPAGSDDAGETFGLSESMMRQK